MRRITSALLLTALLATGSAPAWGATRKSSPTLSAKTVVMDLAAKIHFAHLTIVYNAKTDPNHLLGRPNGYLSKASFSDSRVSSSDTIGDTKGDVGFGGSVEVYPNASAAKARANYIESLEKAAPILGTEYDYVNGPILLRVSQYLTPSQAKGYEQVLADIEGAPAKSSAPSSPSRHANSSKLGSMLLSIGQFPNGWSVDNSSSSGSGSAGCLASLQHLNGHQTQMAEVSFTEGGLPDVDEKLQSFQSAKTAFNEITAIIAHCPRFKGTSDGSTVVGSIGAMSFPHLGDQSAAYASSITIQGVTAGDDMVYARKGSVVMELQLVDISPDPSQLEQFAKKAAAKLP